MMNSLVSLGNYFYYNIALPAVKEGLCSEVRNKTPQVQSCAVEEISGANMNYLTR